ncbi:MAG: hypothetical protein AVDCRST_MAG68-4330 [uncultured Gemmatimonadetes bacterium]|uniref:Uncharacterized protein n=1 Tax=uncultured Gemmatimonadota bacterium TaxID=203437 RepID=A0A6J4MNT1_9BACT|nr:MAG: hypothetical protein AVDCRST_MAG68-4330 [uncultured Gemmatimonadota bacterium]
MPKRLRRELPEYAVRTVVEQGWSGVKNGALLRLAGAEFDVFLTVDQNLRYQQNLSELPLPVVLIVAPSNNIDVLRPLMPAVRELLPLLKPGAFYRVPAE